MELMQMSHLQPSTRSPFVLALCVVMHPCINHYQLRSSLTKVESSTNLQVFGKHLIT